MNVIPYEWHDDQGKPVALTANRKIDWEFSHVGDPNESYIHIHYSDYSVVPYILDADYIELSFDRSYDDSGKIYPTSCSVKDRDAEEWISYYFEG